MQVSYYDHNGDPWLKSDTASVVTGSKKAPSVAGSLRSRRSNSVHSMDTQLSKGTKKSQVSKAPSIAASKRSASIAEDMSVKESVASAISQLTTESQRQYIEQLEKTLIEERRRRIEAEALLK